MTKGPPSRRLRLSAHLGYLFKELPLPARFAAAKSAGFEAIEIPDPYALSRLLFRSLCEENDLRVAQLALPNGGSGAAMKGLAALPGREAEFEDALTMSIAFAKDVQCPLIHPMAGIAAPLEPQPQWEIYLSNLAKACRAAADAGLCVIIEPISASGVPDYFMNSFNRACAAIDEVGAANLLLSVDTFHAAATGVELPAFITRNSARIAHVQVADWPQRDQPGSGQIDFEAVFAALIAADYRGYVGLEYIPSSKGFDWTRRFKPWLEPLA